jgi:CO/xanthine dehydrogenase Mo-binding subunit
MAEVEVDPETGQVEVMRYVVCDDFGKAVNPLIVRGQLQGGVAQGFGQAVIERTAYDPHSGQLLSGTFMDYALPRADDLPDIEVESLEIPCATNPVGVKGAGEAGAVGSPPAAINAIIDALGTGRAASGYAGNAAGSMAGAGGGAGGVRAESASDAGESRLRPLAEHQRRLEPPSP